MSWLSQIVRRAFGTQWGAQRVIQSNDPPARGTREFLEVYETSPWVRAVAGRVAGAIGATEWKLKRGDTGAEVTNNIALATIQRPNPILTAHDVWKLSQLALDLVGDAFLVKERNGLGAPVALWPIPANWVIETPTPDRPFFRISFREWQGSVPANEMLWLHDPAPSNPYTRGTGLVRAQADEIETHEYASKHAKALFWNRATPEIVVMDPEAGEEEMLRHEQHWRQRLQGFLRAMRPYFTNRKLEFWQPTQMNLDNLTMVPLMKHERDVIMQTWGVPPEQFGLVENSNRATIDGSDYVMESRVILPRRQFLAAQLTLKLLPEYDPRLVLGFASTVREDKVHELNVMKAAPWAFGESEWRERAGYAVPAPAGDARLVPLNSFVTTDLEDPEQRPAAAGPAPPEDKPEDEEPEPEPAA
jgi:HK97 family phage portal protein